MHSNKNKKHLFHLFGLYKGNLALRQEDVCEKLVYNVAPWRTPAPKTFLNYKHWNNSIVLPVISSDDDDDCYYCEFCRYGLCSILCTVPHIVSFIVVHISYGVIYIVSLFVLVFISPCFTLLRAAWATRQKGDLFSIAFPGEIKVQSNKYHTSAALKVLGPSRRHARPHVCFSVL